MDKPIIISDTFSGGKLKFSAWTDVSPQEAFEPALADHLIVIHKTPQAVPIFEKADGYSKSGVAIPNDINIFSAGDMSFCRWDTNLSFLRLDLSPALVQQVAIDLDSPLASNTIDLRRQIRLQDDRISHIAGWLFEDMQNGGLGGKIYTDSLIQMFVVHLLHQYGIVPQKQTTIPKILEKSQLSNAQEFIHASLEENISLDEIAKASNISPSHLIRLFKQATGFTPHQYVIREKIRAAQKQLIQGKTIYEVAVSLGFSDQSHFHRHFKRIVGVTPRQFALEWK